ncbi:aquaporin AQPAe.a-like isoform X1 [Photinus pyralis]|uniref:Aquaporin n=2 Tax=Photinus pyralis TaxID=7054 RepID=A0A1Y1LUP4_PHOPY|nr:aquaporin AQPAe.a-like isoform X1 [Photinus pyralis]XP_031342351.1 aquaporin AQPAe.a-like isoform X1 [Photinus pyralis]
MADAGTQTQNGSMTPGIGKMTLTVAPVSSLISVSTTPSSPPPKQTSEKFILMDKLSTVERVILCASELFGTAILVFLGCMSCAIGLSGGNVPHVQISFAFGLAVMLSVQTFGHISGSHINPIITIAAAVTGQLAFIEVPIYFIGQFVGAFIGYGLLMSITPEHHQAKYELRHTGLNITENVKVLGVCSPQMNAELSGLQVMFCEFLLSLLFVLIVCSVWDYRNANKHDSVALKLGLAITGLALAGGPFSGANMNPARSFAPAAWHGDWNLHWAYWIGPILAGFVGGALYRILFTKPRPVEVEDTIEITPLKQRNTN